MTDSAAEPFWGDTDPNEPGARPVYLNWWQPGAADESRWFGFTFELPFTLATQDPDVDSVTLVLETDGGDASIQARYFPDAKWDDYRDVPVDTDESADKRQKHITMDVSDVEMRWAFMSLRVRSDGIGLFSLSTKQSHHAIDAWAGFRED